jgi:hypothetical protein
MSAPFAADPLTTATALLLLPKFGLFTTIWEDPKASEAARFSEDMITARAYWSITELAGDECAVA